MKEKKKKKKNLISIKRKILQFQRIKLDNEEMIFFILELKKTKTKQKKNQNKKKQKKTIWQVRARCE